MKTAILWGLGAAGVIGAILFLLADMAVPSPENMVVQLHGLGVWGPIAVIGLMVLHSFVPFPAEILALCAGAVFGTVLGSVLVWVGAMIGALIAFYLARYLGQEAVRNWVSKDQCSTLDRWAEDRGAVTLLVCRFIPLIAFNLINYAAGLTRVRVWTFVWTTGLGILPLTVLLAYLGSQMKTLSWPVLLGLSIACVVGVVLLSKHPLWRGLTARR
jgi:uncharacterized membrane protein YdjX (TVP38/TMEM64 family)